MYPAYQEAARALCGIIKSAKRFNAASANSKQKPDLYSYANNTIAFCGSRGQGKTSAMLSFGNALRDEGVLSIRRELDPDGMIAGSRFQVMDPIDPTMLKKGGHIAEIVLSYLYVRMRKMFENGKGSELSIREREKVLRRFQQSIGWLSQSSDGGTKSEDFYDFEKPGHGFDIKENLYYIIESFLQLNAGAYNSETHTHYRQCENNFFLVIMLDDMDLQLESGYDVLEEVRQYLQLPNTIVLMAADIVQLRRMIAMHYCSQMDTAIKYELMDQNEIHRLAAKYLDKLIPATQTIYLPEYKPAICRGNDIIVEFEDKEGDGPDSTGGFEKSAKLQEIFFQLIFHKTGLVFVQHKSYVNNLFPSTLRGLRQMYRLFDSMPEPCKPTLHPESFGVESNLEDPAFRNRKIDEANSCMYDYLKQRLSRVRQLESNLAVFKTYFLGDWCASKLDNAGERILEKISRSATPVSFYTALRELDAWRNKGRQPNNSFKWSLRAKESPYSELCVQLDDIAKTGSESAYLLAFAIHTYFSIQLTEEALSEQRNQLEEKLDVRRNGRRCKQEDIFRFSLDYRNLKKRFGKLLFDQEACTLFFDEEIKDRPNLCSIFQLYLSYLSDRNSNRNVPLGTMWRYWDGQDWAVQFCCNWELQEYALKCVGKFAVEKSNTEKINELNEKLLKRTQICDVKDTAWLQFITKEYSSLVQGDVPSLETREDLLFQEKRRDEIQSAIELINTIISFAGLCVNDTSPEAKETIHIVCGMLGDADVVLLPYLSAPLKKKFDAIRKQIYSDFPLSDDIYRQLKSLGTRIHKSLESSLTAEPYVKK